MRSWSPTARDPFATAVELPVLAATAGFTEPSGADASLPSAAVSPPAEASPASAELVSASARRSLFAVLSERLFVTGLAGVPVLTGVGSLTTTPHLRSAAGLSLACRRVAARLRHSAIKKTRPGKRSMRQPPATTVRCESIGSIQVQSTRNLVTFTCDVPMENKIHLYTSEVSNRMKNGQKGSRGPVCSWSGHHLRANRPYRAYNS